MKKITKLPSSLINLIAAGEVVENPLSIIRELVDNSLDASSTLLKIELLEGGQNLIRITDDGSGISKQDAELLFERHATSKISTFDDLIKLQTRGFRGEALSSISSVSKIKVESWTQSDHFQIENHFGKISDYLDLPLIPGTGTSIEVSGLFEEVPARRAFLKSPRYDLKNILEYLDHLASLLPAIQWTVYHNGKLLRDYEKESKADRLKLVSKHLFQKLELFPYVNSQFQLYLSHPSFPYSNTRQIFFSVNNKPVQDRGLIAVCLQGLESILMPGLYPGFILNLKLEPEEFDINISPNKSQVRFRDWFQLRNSMTKFLNDFCKQRSWMKEDFGEIPAHTNMEEVHQTLSFETFHSPSFVPMKSSDFLSVTKEMFDIEIPKITDNLSPNKNLKYLGQIFNKYLLAESPKGLLLIDQHAAQEKINFVQLQSQKIQKQNLLEPLLVEIPEDKLDLSEWEKMGFEVEKIQKRQYRVFQVPVLLLNALGEIPEILKSKKKLDDKMANIACKASIKAGQRLDPIQAEHLIHDMLLCESSSHCPHGRPVYIIHSLDFLDREFLRHL